MRKESLVTVIIVNWNGMKYLADCLGSLSKINYKNTEILFVDNASSDDSVQYVKKNFPYISIIQNTKNLGYAEGHEEALKKSKGKFVLLLSTDTIVEKNILDALVAVMSSKETIGAVMPKLVMYPQTNMLDSIGSFFVTSGILYHFGREKDPTDSLYNRQMDIYSAKGACLLFRKVTLLKTGLFDKDYFAYFEETDLCHRVWLSGYSVVYTPTTTVFHKGGGASKQMANSFIQFHSFKNRIMTYLKNLSLKNLLIVMPQTLFIYECFFLVRLLTGEFSIAFSVQKAILWNMTHLPEILNKRKYIQTKIRKISDDKFLPKVTRSIKISYYYYLFRGLSNYKD